MVPKTMMTPRMVRFLRGIKTEWRPQEPRKSLQKIAELREKNGGSVLIVVPYYPPANVVRTLQMEANKFHLRIDLASPFNGVHLNTIDQVKGLTFEHVLLLGMQDSVYPQYFYKNMAQRHHLSLEKKLRRWLYVALTRASRSVVLAITATPSRLLPAFSDDLYERI